MYYLVHTHNNGHTVHEHKYMTFDEALVDLNENTSYQGKKTLYIVDGGLFFQYVGKQYLPPKKWDGVDRRSSN